MGVLERIKEIELEMSRTQKNKATEGHLGLLKARMAKLKAQLLEPPKGGGGKAEGFDVGKYGDARVALIGFPSVGKSTLLSTVTPTQSEAAAYEFTTLTCIPGIVNYKGATIQLLDLPGIIEGASEGKGRGRQVIAVGRSADLILMVLDAQRSSEQKEKITQELESVGIRLNQRRPDITFQKKAQNGVMFNSTCQLTHMNQEIARKICHEYKIFHAEILFREDATVDQFIDIIEKKNRSYIPCLYVYNKIDNISIEEINDLARQDDSVVISCNMQLNMDYLIERIWQKLGLVRVYTKKPGNKPDFSQPLILTERRDGHSIEAACTQIHRELASDFRCAFVWGKSTKHYAQRCGLKHQLCDEDVVQILKKNK
ncbi:hypothetical protein SteCoe_29794 [Stentor coeruleus]|uniref:OBG-type G domain-containing protein n=1 Tax=Stentor coeruleus TaxID=5963 RepID=A0A1R2B552_9CILI|nr:hypothetical protein SteCoe_29794 [Stentor coeruleus]